MHRCGAPMLLDALLMGFRPSVKHHRQNRVACGILLNCGITGGSMDQKLLDEINEKVKAALAQGPAADVDKNLRAMLAGLFSRLDLVRRDEFDVQREVLMRTRAKLGELEQKVAALEAGGKSKDVR